MTTTKTSVKERRAYNLQHALATASMGIPGFLCVDKRPLFISYQKRDTDMTTEEISVEKAKFKQKHGGVMEAVHCGSTTDSKVIKTSLKHFPDGCWAICPGLSDIVVIDADVQAAASATEHKPARKQKDGPTKFMAYCAENDIDLSGALTVRSQGGGTHWYFKGTGFDSRAGSLRDLDCDVRSGGGFIVLAGAKRADGKEYRIINGDLPGLMSLPILPEKLASAIGTARTLTSSALDVTKEAEGVRALKTAHIPNFEDTFTNEMRKYDLPSLLESDSEFEDVYENGMDRSSDARWKMSRIVMGQWSDMSIAELQCFYEGCPGAGVFTSSTQLEKGEFNERCIVREYSKTKRYLAGGKFDAVDDDDDLINGAETADRMLADTLSKASAPLSFADSDLIASYKPKRWRVKYLIPYCGLGEIHAPANTGKSFLAYDMLSHIVRGMPWMERKAIKCAAIYFNGEGAEAFTSRAKAWAMGHPDVPPGTVHIALNLPDVRDLGKMRRDILAVVDEVEARDGQRVGIICIDTLAKLIAGIKETDNGALELILKKLREIAVERDLVFMILAHPTKSDPTNMRGGGSIIGDADFVFMLSEDKATRSIFFENQKMRDGAKGGKTRFRLRTIAVGKDEDGDDDTSCYVVPFGSDGTAMDAVDEEGTMRQATDDMTFKAALALEMLRDHAAERQDAGDRADDAVPLQELLDRWNARRSGFSDREGKRLKDHDSSQFGRVLKHLEGADRITATEAKTGTKKRVSIRILEVK